MNKSTRPSRKRFCSRNQFLKFGSLAAQMFSCSGHDIITSCDTVVFFCRGLLLPPVLPGGWHHCGAGPRRRGASCGPLGKTTAELHLCTLHLHRAANTKTRKRNKATHLSDKERKKVTKETVGCSSIKSKEMFYEFQINKNQWCHSLWKQTWWSGDSFFWQLNQTFHNWTHAVSIDHIR